ncbi:hypothetical protein GGH94_003068 [Coemansia aciculifera]|uniref:Uncharacterized protein n=1 Tax=Coemansia aciculifera TaxID=417176 RepID=A0A9W8IPG8_9FUNG|nr:hypothetical protein GGH94_003068 [Coemansia aciculifera]KAJ2876882.1 hypothetical protein GGH93_000373 [Coemansia aciculifera]
MRFFVILAVLSCLLALCHAKRTVTLQNAIGQKETYHSDDYHCHRVGRKFHSPFNNASATGGATTYFSDSECKVGILIDPVGKGQFLQIPSGVKAYRAFKWGN